MNEFSNTIPNLHINAELAKKVFYAAIFAASK
jgi:hypothetical protein